MTIAAMPTLSDRAQRDAVLDKVEWVLRGTAEVDVVVREGTVTICGSVRAIADRDRVLHAALSTPGVQVVVDDIAVRTLVGIGSSDEVIAGQVHALLEAMPSVHVEGVRVHIRHGVVTVGGAIPWNFERDTLLNLIGAVSGVGDVIDAVTVTRPDRDPSDAISRAGHAASEAHLDVTG